MKKLGLLSFYCVYCCFICPYQQRRLRAEHALSERFSDQYDRCVLEKAIKEYYYNIVLPFPGRSSRRLSLWLP